MAKKDICNGKESGNWRPGRWTDAKLRRFMRHVARIAWNESSKFPINEQSITLLMNFLAEAKERESGALLHKAGVRTIADVERDAGTKL